MLKLENVTRLRCASARQARLRFGAASPATRRFGAAARRERGENMNAQTMRSMRMTMRMINAESRKAGSKIQRTKLG